MKTNQKYFLIPILVLTMILSLTAVQPAFAQDIVENTTIAGTITAINEATFNFTIETGEGETQIVFVGEAFDLTTILVGDVVEVEGTLNEDGSLAALEVRVEGDEDGIGDETDDLNDGYYCTQTDVPHPFGTRLAERYGTDYATLQAWFCEGFGWGQVMLALHTGQLTGVDPAALLAERSGGSGWGEIWQGLNLTGHSEEADSQNDRDSNGRPDFSERPGNNGNGQDHSDFTGQDDEIEENNSHDNPHDNVPGGQPDSHPHERP